MTLTAIPGNQGLPPEPDWSQFYSDVLDIASAHEQWGIVTREMNEAGTVTVANGHSIKRLVEFGVQYERAARQVAEKGSIVKAKKTGVPMFNPYWTVMRQADEAIRVIEAELGIAPVRRGKATKVQRAKKSSRAADAYLKPVAR